MILLLPLFPMKLTKASEYSTSFEFEPLYKVEIQSNYNSQYESILRIDGLEKHTISSENNRWNIGFYSRRLPRLFVVSRAF